MVHHSKCRTEVREYGKSAKVFKIVLDNYNGGNKNRETGEDRYIEREMH